jgi:hypothetical protein
LPYFFLLDIWRSRQTTPIYDFIIAYEQIIKKGQNEVFVTWPVDFMIAFLGTIHKAVAIFVKDVIIYINEEKVGN